MIKITGLKKSFDKNVVFDGFDLTVEGPGFYALSGPSGSGKTTLLSLCAANPDAAKRRFCGSYPVLTGITREKLRSAA